MPKKVEKNEILNTLCAPMVKACKEHGLTISVVVKTVKEGLSATETRTSYDKDRGKWTYSSPLVDHGHRLEAANIASGFFGLKQDKVKVDLNGKINLDIAGAKQKLLDRVNAIAKRKGKGRGDKRPK